MFRETSLEDIGGKPPAAPRVAAVIPCFRGTPAVCDVIAGIGAEVDRIYLIDDGCPNGSGDRVARECRDPRLVVLHNRTNLGVGGAMKRGYRRALADGASIVVKIDADGQMDPAFIPYLIAPIVAGRADYSKGNRFAPTSAMPKGAGEKPLGRMPFLRRTANALLSLLHKAATGYWRIVDPANGYTAIHAHTLASIDIEALADCYFFETDMLFRLNLVDATVTDLPLPARYAQEVSSLSLRQIAPRFAAMITGRFCQRLAIKYFRRGPHWASVPIAAGVLLVAAGLGLGAFRLARQLAADPAALPIALGLALLIGVSCWEARRAPGEPLWRRPGC